MELVQPGTFHLFSCGHYRLEGFVFRGKFTELPDLIRLVRAATAFKDDPEICLICKRKGIK